MLNDDVESIFAHIVVSGDGHGDEQAADERQQRKADIEADKTREVFAEGQVNRFLLALGTVLWDQRRVIVHFHW